MADQPAKINQESFTGAAGMQLALYAAYAIAALAIVLYLLSLAAGSASGSNVSGAAIDEENNSITIALKEEPPQLDSSRSTDAASGVVLNHVMEGMFAYDQDEKLIPGVAERWEIRDDGATFWLREEARWSDGKPVTAHDFVFAWRHVVDPATAASYAFIMFPIKNGEAINSGNLPIATLGVRALDDRTLEVDFERPTPYFDQLTAFQVYFPIREDFFNSTNGRYGADADQLLYNGPYMVTEWVHSSSMRWEKNPHYWNDERGLLDAINVAYITQDVNAKLNLFKDGQIVDTHLSPAMLTSAMEQGWQIDRFNEGTVFYFEFNHRAGRIGGNYHFRKAIQLAHDPAELVYKVLKEGAYLPGSSLFPRWVKGVNEPFYKEFPLPKHQVDIVAAREHLEIAKQELGVEQFPPIMLLTGDTPVAMLSAEYYQAYYKRHLGLDIRIDAQIFKQRLEKMTAGEFDIVMSGWGPDYFDALTYGDLFASWNLQNRGRYNNPELDAQVRIAQAELDPVKRMHAFGEIQRILYEQAVIIPEYERGVSFVVNPRLKGFQRRIVGSETDYVYAYIEKSDD